MTSSIFCEASKYFMILLFAFYTWECFSVLKGKTKEQQDDIFRRQAILLFLLHFDGYLVLFDRTDNPDVLFFYGAQAIFFVIVLGGGRLLYETPAQLLVNNLCMLLVIGFLVLSRLSYEKAVKQFAIAVGSMIVSLGVPFLIKKIRLLKKLAWFYAAAGLLSLAAVAAAGQTSYGAKISLSLAGISIQPSEFVKLLFVFFLAGMLHRSSNLKQLALAAAVAAAHILLLVFSRDLGGALIFFVVFLVMAYAATGRLLLFLGGLLSGSIAAAAAYRLFAHVRVRVVAWRDPLSVIDKEGYQVCQSLFAIGTGGWFGTGLFRGMPEKIPKVEQDVIFSAVSEELGGIFALCLILVCMSCFLMFFNIAMQSRDNFYRLAALGLGTMYGFQVFLTIGGVIKFIPSTGVTLPLVSYGGSSLFCTILLFAVIQGFYLLRESEGKKDGEAQS